MEGKPVSEPSTGSPADTAAIDPPPAGRSALLLETKLYAPPVRSNQITRSRLYSLLDAGLDRALVLVSAPAGYGKTTLLCGWLKEKEIPSAWLSLDEGDNDPIRFLQYLAAALRPFAPGLEADLPGLFTAIPPAPLEHTIARLVNELNSISTPFVLVLDDFHVLHSEAAMQIASYLLEHLPPAMHLAFLTRADPPLPLPRLRVRQQLLDIRAENLRFTQPEIASFLNDAAGAALTAADLAAMETRTEGWIAGLQLAALSMQGCGDIHGFVSAFTGSHHYVMDYLVEEVLKLQPDERTAFLLQTSILDRLCGPLCEAVMGGDPAKPGGGQAMLETLEGMNLFTVPLDGERRWFRYHHLFADVLRKHLEHRLPLLRPTLHRRASEWYERNGFLAESIQQAIAAADPDRAARLIEENGCQLLISGEVSTLLQWADAIEFQSETRPWLAIQKAWALALTGELERVEPTLAAPDRLLSPLEPTVEIRTMQGTIAAARAHCANAKSDTRSAAEHARKALALLPDCSSISRSIRSVATSILGDASWINGDLEEASRAYSDAIRIGREAGNPHMTVIAGSNLAEVQMEQGRLGCAADTYAQALPLAIRPDGRRSPLAGGILAGLGRLAYERNRLEEADQYLRPCLELCREWNDGDLQASACALTGRLELARGRPLEAQKAIREAERLAGQYAISFRRSMQIKSDLGRVFFSQNNPGKLAQLLPASGLPLEGEIPDRRAPEYNLLLRTLLSQGDYEGAAGLSERLLPRAEAAGRMGSVIEILILQALAFQGMKETGQALAALERALALAQPEGYVRTFLDEGEAMTRLLCQARSRQAGNGYAAELLAAIGAIPGMTQPSMQILKEPLTAREVEVLKLIEAGCSNQKIAGQLVISIPTVKRHISNIYAKLEVNSRTQAVAIGKELKIFE
jgi:LuxR family maltose regulon positive regulatory protein